MCVRCLFKILQYYTYTAGSLGDYDVVPVALLFIVSRSVSPFVILVRKFMGKVDSVLLLSHVEKCVLNRCSAVVMYCTYYLSIQITIVLSYELLIVHHLFT